MATYSGNAKNFETSITNMVLGNDYPAIEAAAEVLVPSTLMKDNIGEIARLFYDKRKNNNVRLQHFERAFILAESYRRHLFASPNNYSPAEIVRLMGEVFNVDNCASWDGNDYVSITKLLNDKKVKFVKSGDKFSIYTQQGMDLERHQAYVKNKVNAKISEIAKKYANSPTPQITPTHQNYFSQPYFAFHTQVELAKLQGIIEPTKKKVVGNWSIEEMNGYNKTAIIRTQTYTRGGFLRALFPT
jgi:hypothetical protein